MMRGKIKLHLTVTSQYDTTKETPDRVPLYLRKEHSCEF